MPPRSLRLNSPAVSLRTGAELLPPFSRSLCGLQAVVSYQQVGKNTGGKTIRRTVENGTSPSGWLVTPGNAGGLGFLAVPAFPDLFSWMRELTTSSGRCRPLRAEKISCRRHSPGCCSQFAEYTIRNEKRDAFDSVRLTRQERDGNKEITHRLHLSTGTFKSTFTTSPKTRLHTRLRLPRSFTAGKVTLAPLLSPEGTSPIFNRSGYSHPPFSFLR